MSAPPTHVCRFRYIKKEGNWRRSGAFQEREIERISTCESCGTERIGRFRRILAVEKESAGDVSNPDIYVRGLARKLETLFQTRDHSRRTADPPAWRCQDGSGHRTVSGIWRHSADISTALGSAASDSDSRYRSITARGNGRARGG